MTESQQHSLHDLYLIISCECLGQFGASSAQAILVNIASFPLDAGMAWG